MAYVEYTGLTSPDEVIEAMADYIATRGYTVVQPLVDDLNIHDMASTDGKKFCFLNRDGDYFINLRSANGTHVFGNNDDADMDLHAFNMGAWEHCNMFGVAMTVSEGYSPAARWYNQFNVPKVKGGKNVLGVFMPVTSKIIHTREEQVDSVPFYPNTPYGYDCVWSGDYLLNKGTVDDPEWVGMNEYTWVSNFTWTLYCNNIVEPTDTLVFSLVKENDTFHQASHLIYADVHKYDSWTGGAIFSGTYSYYYSGECHEISDFYLHGHNVCYSYLPILCSSSGKSNTFLRIDIDEAPTNVRGNIYWASSGTSNETGKKLSLPIRTGDGLNGQIPHYYVLQSKSMLDWGRNINTLNCITMDMPIYGAVLVDPDLLNNYAGVGDISGVYCVSLLNMQTAGTYERNYPRSNDLDQVFPHRMRRDGVRGFDGIAIRQNEVI